MSEIGRRNGDGGGRAVTEVTLPLGRQLVVRLAAEIRSGEPPPGDPLPGARRMAARLGVHRHTVRTAYLELARMGLVEVRPGSGVYPLPPLGPGRRRPGSGLFTARHAGRSAAELDDWLARWSAAVRSRRVIVLGSDPRRRALWARELRVDLRGLGVEVVDRPVEAVGRLGGPFASGRGLLAVPEALLERVTAEAPSWAEIFPLRPGPAARVRRLLQRLPSGSVVAVVTRCGAVVGEIEELAAALRGGEVAVAAVSPRDDGSLSRMSRVARFVLADEQGRRAATVHVPLTRLLTLRDLDPAAGRELRAFLRVEEDGMEGGTIGSTGKTGTVRGSTSPAARVSGDEGKAEGESPA